MAKKILTKNKDKLHELILETIGSIESAVKSTLGPAGKNVMLDQGYSVKMTKDGVSVAKAIEFEEADKKAIGNFFKTAATHTVDQAGDGTTTSIVLAAEIFKSALKGISVGANSVEVKKGIEEAVKIVVSSLDDLKITVANDFEKIKQVAIVSANGDKEIGDLITEAFERIGSDGVITVEEGQGREHELKVVDGMQFDRGYISPYFATNNEKMVAELDNPAILIYDKKISSIQSILHLLKQINESGRSLLIISEDIDGDVLPALILNKLKGVLKVVAVKAPGFGDRRKEVCQDIAILTGGEYVSEDLGLKLDKINLDNLGSAKKVVISANETIIVEGHGSQSALTERIAQIKSQIENSTSDYDKEKLRERLAKLAGGVAVLKVGGVTEESAKECKDRVDDAVQAVKSAISEGIVPGGSVSLLYSNRKLREALQKASGDKKIGYQAVLNAIEAPLSVILENAGRKDLAVVLDKIYSEHAKGNKNFGLDARNDSYGDLIAMGIVDPLKVVRCALTNASEVAGMLLVCDAAIITLPEKSENGGPSMPMM